MPKKKKFEISKKRQLEIITQVEKILPYGDNYFVRIRWGRLEIYRNQNSWNTAEYPLNSEEAIVEMLESLKTLRESNITGIKQQLNSVFGRALNKVTASELQKIVLSQFEETVYTRED